MTDDEIKEASARCDVCNALHNTDGRCPNDLEADRWQLLLAQKRLEAKYAPAHVAVAVDAGEAAVVLDESRVDASDSRTRIITDTEENDQ